MEGGGEGVWMETRKEVSATQGILGWVLKLFHFLTVVVDTWIHPENETVENFIAYAI